ncbi:PulJ/GspJ family protein [Mucilaginibacter sp.]
MNKRVKAFTIMEITVVMLISAIVIGIAYTAFNIIGQSYRSFQHKNEELAVLIRLDELLRKDFSRADTISKTAGGIFVKTGTDSVTYAFEPDFTVRTSTIIDTFKLNVQDVTASFETSPITTIDPVSEQNRIDELDFSILFENEKIPYTYYKQYSSANLIERNPNAIN